MMIKNLMKTLTLLFSLALLLLLCACGGGGGGGGEGQDDTLVPNVTAFALPATSNSLTLAIDSFIASDNVGVTGYCLAETDSSIGCIWSATAPTSYTFASVGSKTLYAFAQDAAGNISASRSATTAVLITVKVTFALLGAPATIYSAQLDILLPDGFVLEVDSFGQPTASAVTLLVAGATLDVNFIPATTANGEIKAGIIKSDGFSGDVPLLKISCTYPVGATLPTAGDFVVTASAGDVNGVETVIPALTTITPQAAP